MEVLVHNLCFLIQLLYLFLILLFLTLLLFFCLFFIFIFIYLIFHYGSYEPPHRNTSLVWFLLPRDYMGISLEHLRIHDYDVTTLEIIHPITLLK